MRISSRFKSPRLTSSRLTSSGVLSLCMAIAAVTIAGCSAPQSGRSGAPAVQSQIGAQVGSGASSATGDQGANQGSGVAGSPDDLAGNDETVPTDIAIEVLHKANYNPFEIDNGKSFRTLQNLDVYRAELGRHSIETPKQIDFKTQQVLVSSAGEKPSGGYTITATKIEDIEDSVIVTVVQSIPGPSCINTQGKTHPYEFILVPSTKPIQIFERKKVKNCR